MSAGVNSYINAYPGDGDEFDVPLEQSSDEVLIFEAQQLTQNTVDIRMPNRIPMARAMLKHAAKIAAKNKPGMLVYSVNLAEHAARIAIPGTQIEKNAAQNWLIYWRQAPDQILLAQTALRFAREESELQKTAKLALSEFLKTKRANDSGTFPIIPDPAIPVITDQTPAKVSSAGMPSAAGEITARPKKPSWFKKHGLAMGLGAATGIGMRFAMAAFVTTVPGFAVTVAAGAVIGAASSVVSALVSGERDKKKLLRRAVVGAVSGAAFSVIGVGLVGLYEAGTVLHDVFSGHAFNHVPSINVDNVSGHVPITTDTPTAAAPPPVAHAPAPTLPVTDAPAVTPPVAHAAPVPPPPTPVPTGIDGIVSADTMKQLPEDVRRLATSDSAEKLVRFCKDASHELLSGPHRNPQAAVELMRRGLEIAEKSNIHTAVMEHAQQQLHADLAYSEAWGKGTAQNIPDALEHARKAGSVMNNFGGRLLALFKAAPG